MFLRFSEIGKKLRFCNHLTLQDFLRSFEHLEPSLFFPSFCTIFRIHNKQCKQAMIKIHNVTLAATKSTCQGQYVQLLNKNSANILQSYTQKTITPTGTQLATGRQFETPTLEMIKRLLLEHFLVFFYQHIGT